MKLQTKIPCPICGHEQARTVNLAEAQFPELVLCDVEEGGCDEYFAVKSNVNITFEHVTSVLNFVHKAKS